MVLDVDHASKSDPVGAHAAAKEVWKEKGLIARVLCTVSAMDYACWRDLPDGVPDLCQEVYSTDEFSEAILNPDKELLSDAKKNDDLVKRREQMRAERKKRFNGLKREESQKAADTTMTTKIHNL